MIDWALNVVQARDGSYYVSIDRFTYRPDDLEGRNPKKIETRIIETKFGTRDEAEAHRAFLTADPRVRFGWRDRYWQTAKPLARKR